MVIKISIKSCSFVPRPSVILSESGNIPVARNWFMINVNGLIIVGVTVFGNLRDMPSCPVEYFVFRELIVFKRYLNRKCVSFACAYKHSIYQLLLGRWNFVSAIKLYHYCVGIWHIPTNVNDFCTVCAWWRHQMETFSALLAFCAGNSPVTCEFPSQRPATWSFDVFFDLRLNKRLSKQSRGWLFETSSHPLWRHCNGWNVLPLNNVNQVTFFSESCSNSFTFLNESSLTKKWLEEIVIRFSAAIPLYYSSC